MVVWKSVFVTLVGHFEETVRRKLTSNTTSIGGSMNPINFPRPLPDSLVRYFLMNIGPWRFGGTTIRRKRSIYQNISFKEFQVRLKLDEITE